MIPALPALADAPSEAERLALATLTEPDRGARSMAVYDSVNWPIAGPRCIAAVAAVAAANWDATWNVWVARQTLNRLASPALHRMLADQLRADWSEASS